MTLHREENTDSDSRLLNIISALDEVSMVSNRAIIFPTHPRTHKRLDQLIDNKNRPKRTISIEPMGYLPFLRLLSRAKLCLTDSGGVQQEACILGVPCVTLRDNTEWTETLVNGANILAGAEPNRIVEAVRKQLENRKEWKQPFGDGKSAEKIVNVLKVLL